MEIDRARFLLLTASLAGGCSSNPTTEPLAPTAPTTAEATVPEVPEPATTASGDTSTAGTSSSQSGSDSGSDSGSGTTSTGSSQAACDNDSGTVPACSIAGPPGPHCEGLSDAKATCKAFKSSLRAGIAARAVACLNGATKTQAICDYSKLESCTTTAIRSACIQPSTFNLCSPVVAQCAGERWSKLTMEDCQMMLSAVKDGKRQAMITCMSEGCSLDSCAWSLR